MPAQERRHRLSGRRSLLYFRGHRLIICNTGTRRKFPPVETKRSTRGEFGDGAADFELEQDAVMAGPGPDEFVARSVQGLSRTE